MYMATDGWAIGVNAIALSGKVAGSGGDGFARFFENMAWNAWDAELQNFCMRTSIADEFDTELAAALSGRDDAHAVMEDLSRSNSFLSRLHGDTYRYHHLFQEFLQKQLKSSGTDEAMLYKTAARYYKDHEDYSRALRFWLQSGDYKGTDNFLFLFLFRGHKNGVADYADFLHGFFKIRCRSAPPAKRRCCTSCTPGTTTSPAVLRNTQSTWTPYSATCRASPRRATSLWSSRCWPSMWTTARR